MKFEISEEAWLNLDRFLRETPNLLDKLPAFRDAINKRKRITQQRTQQRVLVRLFHLKFPHTPKTVAERIQATESIETLDRWLDEIFVANDLADTELGRMS